MIQMIGIDYTTAPVDIRAVFALRRSEMPETMEKLKNALGASGVILLSTCNRMEIWVSTRNAVSGILETLCSIIGLEPEGYRSCFVTRQEDEAARHLFRLTSGLKSAIVAEDQILTQVKDASDLARMHKLIDSPLEVLFRSAITAAKRVKTEVTFHRGNATAIEKAIALVEQEYFPLAGRQVMVIGNGEYGRLASAQLLKAGAKVTVTIRQYHSGEVKIPEGASAILYGEKYTLFPDCDLVVSATTSPNYTLFCDKVAKCPVNGKKILIDLAVPRDIDPEIRKLPGYVVYDIDDFQSELGSENADALHQADAIIEEELEEFRAWISFRDVIPMIDAIRADAVGDIIARLEKPLHKLPAEDDAKDALTASIEDASGKVIANLFYYLRDNLDEGAFRACIQAAYSRLSQE